MSFLYWQKFNLNPEDAEAYMEKIDTIWPLYDKYSAKYPSETTPMKIVGKWYGPGYRRANVFEFRDLIHQQEFFKINRSEAELIEWNQTINEFIDELTWSAEFWGEVIHEELVDMEKTDEVNNIWYIQKWLIKQGKTDEATEVMKKLLRLIYSWIKNFPEYAKMKGRFFWKWYQGNTVYYIIEAEDMEQLKEATKKANEDEELIALNKDWLDLLVKHSWEAEIWQINKRPKED